VQAWRCTVSKAGLFLLGVIAFFVLTAGIVPRTAVCAPILSADVGTLDSTGADTSGTNYSSTGLSATIDMPDAGAALVLATFSMKSTGHSCLGGWRLSNGDPNSTGSLEIQRYLISTADAGVGSATHIFTGLSSGSNTFTLYHKDYSDTHNITTYDGSLVAIPLVTDDGTALNYSFDTLASETVTATTLTALSGLTTDIDMPAAGDAFIALSFSCESAGGSGGRRGTWDIQVDGTTVGMSVERELQGSNDAGAITLFALAEGLNAGSHTITVRGATDESGKGINTYNATLAAVALSLSNGLYFPAFQNGASGTTTTTCTSYSDAVTDSFTLPDDSKVFLAGSCSLSGTSVYGYTRLRMGDYCSQEVERYSQSATSYGSAENVGLTGSLTAGAYTPSLQFKSGTSDTEVYIYNPNIVGFSMTATPEPATASLALLAAGAGALVARRKKKKKNPSSKGAS